MKKSNTTRTEDLSQTGPNPITEPLPKVAKLPTHLPDMPSKPPMSTTGYVSIVSEDSDRNAPLDEDLVDGR